MPHLATVSPKFQISLPKALRERLGLKPGDQLVVEESQGNLVLIPSATVPREQLYFWSRRWQEGEARAEEDIRSGRVSRPYGSAETEQMAKDLLQPTRRTPRKRKAT